jgi:hypothetical protein
MSHPRNPRRRLLSEALVHDEERLPAAAYTCWTIVLVTASLTLIALSALYPLGV